MASYELPIYCERRRRGPLAVHRKLLAGMVALFLVFGFVASKGFGLFEKGVSDDPHRQINRSEELKSAPSPSASPRHDSNIPRHHTPEVPPPSSAAPQFRGPKIPSTQSSQVPPPSGSQLRGPNVVPRPSKPITPNITDKTVTVSKIVPACPTRIIYSVDEDFEATVEVVEG